MFQHRSSKVAFRIATVLMIVLGLANGMLGVVLAKFFPALDPQAAADIAPPLLTLWLVTVMTWVALLIGQLRSNRPRRGSVRRRRKREPSQQPTESTMQGQWKQQDVNQVWTDGNNDTRERIDRTERKTASADTTVPVSMRPHSSRADFAGNPDIPSATELARPSTWSLALLQELEWHRFEQVCADFLESLGLEAKPLAESPDSQVSLQIWQPGVAQMHAIAKTHAGAKTVEVERIRALFKVQSGYQLDKAFFLSAGSFSPQALAAGRDARLVLIDGMAMLAHLLALPQTRREALLALATSGDYRSPTCPACSSKMVMCNGEFKSFWRCSDYPICSCRLTQAGDSVLFT